MNASDACWTEASARSYRELVKFVETEMDRVSLWFSLLTFLNVKFVTSRSTGPPIGSSVCINLMPSGSSPHVLRFGNGSYRITLIPPLIASAGYFTYEAGQTYSLNLIGGVGISFRGFLIQAWDPSATRIGTMKVTDSENQQLLDCSAVDGEISSSATIAHARPNTKPSITVMWTAPMEDAGMVDFRFTVVKSYIEYFGPLSAASTDGSISAAESPVLPSSVTKSNIDPEDYRITARVPSRCRVMECTVFVGIGTNKGNEDYLDIYLEGKADAWVAVGFTDSPNMFNADVIACNFNPNSNRIEVLDTWNPSTRDNELDGIQNVFLREGSFTNGRLSCKIARKILVEKDFKFDLNLNESLYLIYGVGPVQAPRALRSHALGLVDTPEVSKGRVNISSGSTRFGANDVRRVLTRLHGILMWISWPILGMTGIFFALWMRPIKPEGRWFQVHRALMVASLFVGALGVFFIFVAQYRRGPIRGLINFKDNTLGVVHFTFGVTVMLLHILNPLIALCRCHPGTPNRWIFNWIHGYGIGMIGQLFALITIGLGIAIFNETVSLLGPGLNFFWVYFVYAVGYIGMNLILSLVYTYTKKKIPEEKSSQLSSDEMDQGIPEKPDQDEKEQQKKKSKENRRHWGVFFAYLVLLVVFSNALIILFIL